MPVTATAGVYGTLPTSAQAYSDIELALIRGTLNLPVTNQGRLDPSTETVRRRGGIVGAFRNVRVVNEDAVVADPVRNPFWQTTFRDSYRLGNALEDTSLNNVVVYPGRQ